MLPFAVTNIITEEAEYINDIRRARPTPHHFLVGHLRMRRAHVSAGRLVDLEADEI